MGNSTTYKIIKETITLSIFPVIGIFSVYISLYIDYEDILKLYVIDGILLISYMILFKLSKQNLYISKKLQSTLPNILSGAFIFIIGSLISEEISTIKTATIFIAISTLIPLVWLIIGKYTRLKKS